MFCTSNLEYVSSSSSSSYEHKMDDVYKICAHFLSGDCGLDPAAFPAAKPSAYACEYDGDFSGPPCPAVILEGIFSFPTVVF